jgi:exodeoxyribonuclease VII small subunit
MSEEQEELDLEPNQDFSSAIDRLKEIVRDLENGELALEDAMEKYEEGRDLIGFCESKLEDAELLIEEVDDSDPENPELNPKEPEE